MKTSPAKLKALETPVFPVVVRKRRTKLDVAAAKPKAKKRDNIFSKSRDLREDRGERQMKASQPQTFSHGR